MDSLSSRRDGFENEDLQRRRKVTDEGVNILFYYITLHIVFLGMLASAVVAAEGVVTIPNNS